MFAKPSNIYLTAFSDTSSHTETAIYSFALKRPAPWRLSKAQQCIPVAAQIDSCFTFRPLTGSNRRLPNGLRAPYRFSRKTPRDNACKSRDQKLSNESSAQESSMLIRSESWTRAVKNITLSFFAARCCFEKLRPSPSGNMISRGNIRSYSPPARRPQPR